MKTAIFIAVSWLLCCGWVKNKKLSNS